MFLAVKKTRVPSNEQNCVNLFINKYSYIFNWLRKIPEVSLKASKIAQWTKELVTKPYDLYLISEGDISYTFSSDLSTCFMVTAYEHKINK